MRAVLRVVAVNAVVFVVLAGFIEGCVRLTHPSIGPLGTDSVLVADGRFGSSPGPRPGATGYSNGARFQATPDGFWHYSANGDTAGASWLLLGDSVTMGIGVTPDSTFAGRLASYVKNVRVLNPSLIGFSSDDYVEVLASVASSTPDLSRVTIFWCLNDVYSRGAVVEDPGQNVRRTLGPILQFVYEHVYTYQWLKAVLFDRPQAYYRHDAQLYRDPELLEGAIFNLLAIEDQCREKQIRCEIVLIPYEYQLRPNAEEDRFKPQDVLGNRLDGSRLTVHDPSESLRQAAGDPSDLFLYGDGIHLSSKGHSVLADYVATTLNLP